MCLFYKIGLVGYRISGIDGSSMESLKPFYFCFHFPLNRASGVEVEYMDLVCFVPESKALPLSGKPRP
jgi:hypothetical protein